MAKTTKPRYRYYRIHHVTKNAILSDVTLHTRILRTYRTATEMRRDIFPPSHGYHVERITAALAKALIELWLENPKK